MHLYIVRHGECYGQIDPALGMEPDTALTPRGEQQAAEAGKRLAAWGVTRGCEPRFDVHQARVHLTRHLAFVEQPLANLPSLQPAFERWFTAHADVKRIAPPLGGKAD